MHMPHSTHSEFSIFSSFTMPFTSRLIGQLRVQVWQSLQAPALARNRTAGIEKRLLNQRPIIMKGAIQQAV